MSIASKLAISIIEGLLFVVALPGSMLGAVVLVARLWKINLRPMLPWLQALRWIAWSLIVAATFASTLLDLRGRFWLLLGLIGICFYGGLDLVERWVRRRYDPESDFGPPVEWWPSPRE